MKTLRKRKTFPWIGSDVGKNSPIYLHNIFLDIIFWKLFTKDKEKRTHNSPRNLFWVVLTILANSILIKLPQHIYKSTSLYYNLFHFLFQIDKSKLKADHLFKQYLLKEQKDFSFSVCGVGLVVYFIIIALNSFRIYFNFDRAVEDGYVFCLMV